MPSTSIPIREDPTSVAYLSAVAAGYVLALGLL